MTLHKAIGKQQVLCVDWGLIPYQEAWDRQEKVFADAVGKKLHNRADSTGSPKEVAHHLFLCEHPPVITLGKNADPNNLLVQAGEKAGVEVFHINRGGDITFHGPGQLVGYPILDLDQFFTDIGRYLRYLEEVIIRLLADYGVQGERLPGVTGVWLDPKDPFKARKICAMGIKCSRWVTMHGFAFNVNTDLRYFDMIIPCGIADKGVTSLEKEIGHAVDMQEIKTKYLYYFKEVFECEMYA